MQIFSRADDNLDKTVSTAIFDGAQTRRRMFSETACKMSSTRVDVFPVPGCDTVKDCTGCYCKGVLLLF